MRQKTVLDSGDETVGTVANLYVDEDSRQLRFMDVITDDQHYIRASPLAPRALRVSLR